MRVLVEFLLIAAIVEATALASYTWRRRPMAGATPLFVMLAASGFWSMIYWLALEHTDLQGKIIWTSIGYIGILMIYPATAMLVLQYIHKGYWLSRPRVYILAIEPIITLALIWTNSFHHLFWSSIQLESAGPFTTLTLQYGPAFWAHEIFANVLLVLAAAALIFQIFHTNHIYRDQIISIFVSAMIPWIVNLLFIFGFSPIKNINLSFISFAITSPLLAWGLFRHRFPNLVPVAYDAIIESMQDGILVLDQVNRVVALNPSAETITSKSVSEVIGMPSDSSFTGWPALIEFIESGEGARTDVLLKESENPRYFEFNAASLFDQAGHKSGRFIVIRDITRSKKSEASQKRRAEEAETLRLATATVGASLHQDVSIERMLEQLGRMVPYDSAAVQLMRDDYLEIVGGRGLAEKSDLVGTRFPIPGNNPNTIVIQTRQPYILDDTTEKNFTYLGESTHHIRSWLGVPLIVHDNIIGMFSVSSETSHYFTQDHARLVSTFADQVAIAIENARLYQEARQAAERRAILHQASQEVVIASLDPERIYTTIHQAAAKLMPSEAFAISLMNETTHMIDAVYLVDHKGRAPAVSIPAHRGLSGHVINTGKSLYIEDMLDKLDTYRFDPLWR